MNTKSLLSCLVVLIVGVTHFCEADPPVASGPAGGSTNRPLVIIVHKSNPVDNLSRSELRRTLMVEESHWPDGRRPTVALLQPGAAERANLLQAVRRFSEQDYDKHLLQLAYTGNTHARPKELTTPINVRKFVLNVPSAVGCIEAADADASIKIVRVDGHLPGEPGYPLEISIP